MRSPARVSRSIAIVLFFKDALTMKVAYYPTVSVSQLLSVAFICCTELPESVRNAQRWTTYSVPTAKQTRPSALSGGTGASESRGA